MKRNTLILVLISFLFACGPYIWFKVPQPEGEEDLSIFPEILLGKYSSAYDTSVIRIERDKIIKEYRENLIMTRSEFHEETGDTISEDTSFNFAGNWVITIRSIGDTIKIFSTKDEELFRISEFQLLRKFREYYFLNIKDSNEYWKVKILTLKGDSLEFDDILTDDDIAYIKNITAVEVYTDTSRDEKKYFLKPTKRELKKILKRRMQGEKFVKLN